MYVKTQQQEQVTQGERDQLRAEVGRMTQQLDELRRKNSEEGKVTEWAKELGREVEELRQRLQGAEEERAKVGRTQAEVSLEVVRSIWILMKCISVWTG